VSPKNAILHLQLYKFNAILHNTGIGLKTKGQQRNLATIELLAYVFMGLWDGSRLSILGARRRGFNSLRSIRI
jgi:hypothetical protein